MMSSGTSQGSEKSLSFGFTLIELVIVLVIVSVMTAMILPYARTSTNNLELQHHCLNIAQAVRYGRHLASKTGTPTRLIINIREKSYGLQIATRPGSYDFKDLEDAAASTRYIGRNVAITDMDGFDMTARQYYLVFDPAGTWPNASILLSTAYAAKRVTISAKRIKVEDLSI